MADCPEQSPTVRFCFRLGESGSENYSMLKTAYDGGTLNKTRVYEWFPRFKNGEYY